MGDKGGTAPTGPESAENDNEGAHAEPAAMLTASQLQQLIESAVSGAVGAVLAAQPMPPGPGMPNSQPPSVPTQSLKRPERPSIDLDANESRWAFFLNEWKFYKQRANLPASAAGELRACCSEELRMELFEFLGSTSFDSMDEVGLLAAVKKLAVRGKNTAVHRNEFYAMRQASGQTIQQFVAKLRAKAEHCNFTMKCSSTACDVVNNFSASMVSDRMIVGCYDDDIQNEVLAKYGQLGTFDEKFSLMQALESGKNAKTQLGGESSVAAQKSSYQRDKRRPTRPNLLANTATSPAMRPNRPTLYDHQTRPGGTASGITHPQTCPGCGSNSHGPGTEKPRRDHCPAWNKKCNHCALIGHLARVCSRRSHTGGPTPPPTPASEVSTVTEGPNPQAQPPHHEDPPPSWFLGYTCEENEANRRFSIAALHTNRQAWQQRQLTPTPSSHVPTRIIVPHMEWVEGEQRFVQNRPLPLPTTTVLLEVIPATHAAFGNPLPVGHNVRPRKSPAFADSCAQTCACGPDILTLMGLHERDLIPTSHRIIGVTKSALDILGVFFAKITCDGATTRQMIYVSSNASGFYLSHSALMDLGCLPGSFPSPPPGIAALHDNPVNLADGPTCSCPRRTPPPPKPDSLPVAPTAANVPKLEKWLLNHFASSAFNTCEHQPLPHMAGDPLEIHFRPDATPKAYHCPIPVPHHWKQKVKADLDRDVRLGIIEPVPPGTPTIWCSRMVVVPKKDGSPRRTVDLQDLNAATYRATHHTPSPFNQASLVPPNTRKTILDAWNGYHSLKLSDAARDATTFITEWGRFRYRRAPQGLHSAGDGYTKSYDDITIDVQRKTKCIDDTILWDDTIASSFWHTIDYINLCSSKGIVFNPSKFQFAREEVNFAGFTLAPDGIRPTPDLLQAIATFPKPTNITDARSWFGLVNQVAFSIADSSAMQPFRELLKPGQWYWDSSLDRAFEDSKKAIVQMVQEGIRHFETHRPTCLSTDWSKEGLGFILLQKHCRCGFADAPICCKDGWRLILAGSRFTTPAESRYAPIEGEALAVAYALEKCRMFVVGCDNLMIATDHKPLVKILGDATMDSIKNPRLFSLKERTLPYKYTIKHIPGTKHAAPDACSRRGKLPASTILCTRLPTEDEVDSSFNDNAFMVADAHTAIAALCTIGPEASAITIDRVRDAGSSDNEYSDLLQAISAGFPDDASLLAPHLRPYWKVREDLSYLNGLALYGHRIIIPRPLRKEVLECLHSAHQGTAGMKARANASVYWPGMSSDITGRRAQCHTCNTIIPSQSKEPLYPSKSPTYPFEQTVADYFHLHGYEYLVYADRYTGWVTIAQCPPLGNNAANLKRELRTLFGIYGAPAEISTDGGSPFSSKAVQDFLHTWGVTWRLSSAYYAQSNGRAELAVKTCKRLLRDNISAKGDLDNDKVARALLQYRNTPLPGLQQSPAQLLYGRHLRDHLPSFADALRIRPEWLMVAEDRERALAQRHVRMIEQYNTHTHSLPDLCIGDTVMVQNQTGNNPLRWEKSGTITEVHNHGQYVIRLHGSGRCTLRNRRFLRKCVPFPTAGLSPHGYNPPTDHATRPEPSHQTASPHPPCTPIHTSPPAPPPLPPPVQGTDATPQTLPPSRPRSDAPPSQLPQEPPVDPPQLPPHHPGYPDGTPETPDDSVGTATTPPRRSSRAPRPRRTLSPCMRGPSHTISMI